MSNLFCPECQKPSPSKFWDFLPGLSLSRKLFWCRACQNWFQFSDRSTDRAKFASIATSVIVFGGLLFYDKMSEARMPAGGWPAAIFLLTLVLLCNLSSAIVLKRSAELIGPIDHSP